MFYRCPRCAELFAADTVPLAKCTVCGVLLRVSPVEMPADAEESLAPPVAVTIAWEQPGSIVRRYIGTLRQLVRSAPQFFYSLPVENPGQAERFAYVSSLIGIAGYCAVQLWLTKETDLDRLLDIVAQAGGRTASPGGLRKFFAWCFALSPLLAALPAHLAAGLYQLGFWFFRTGPRPYDLTFRVAAYGLAPMVLLAIPGVGPLLAPGWIFALHWTGLAAAHRVPLLVSLLAILMPLLSVGLLILRGIGQLLILSLTH